MPADPVVSPADTIRQALNDYLPDGFRDDDGVWHDGPVQSDALIALDALLVERQQAEERNERLEWALAALLGFAREVDIQATLVQGGVDVRAVLAGEEDAE